MIRCTKRTCYAKKTDGGEMYCYPCAEFVTMVPSSVSSPLPAAQKVKRADGPSEIVQMFEEQWRNLCSDLPAPEREYPPFRGTRHMCDYAWPSAMVIVEVEGWGHGQNNRYKTDLYKYNRLSAEGWKLFRCNRAILFDDPEPFFAMVRRAIERHV